MKKIFIFIINFLFAVFLHHNFIKLASFFLKFNFIKELIKDKVGLIYGCKHCSTEMVQLLLEKLDNYNNSFNNALYQSVILGRINIIKLLLKDGRANPSYQLNFAMVMVKDIETRKLIFKDKRVQNTLKYNSPNIYKEFSTEIIKNKVSSF
jgi:hypothetical protein